MTAGLTFLKARRIVAAFAGGPDLSFRLAMSGTPEPLLPYLSAAAALAGRTARVRTLPFGTLHQFLADDETVAGEDVLLLTPWDLAPETDWRPGVTTERVATDRLLDHADGVARQVAGRGFKAILYLPAPIAPTTGTPEDDARLACRLAAIAADAGARILPADAFSIASYLASGCPVGGAALGAVATAVVDALDNRPVAKVLVTDLDNVLWSGVIAEDGPTGIAHGPEGAGYRHFIYQTFLARLRREGVLLAVVSRNDPEVALAPLRAGSMPLTEADFVATLAGYHAKSEQIRRLAGELNLGEDAFVFVDDNPVELAEVSAALPKVHCVPFPAHDEDLPGLLRELGARFARRDVTQEDRDRTDLYRRRLEGMAPAEASGADVTAFLRGLDMRLVLRDRSTGDRTRAVQLINKTNQFNLNGRRWSDEEVGGVLAQGGRLVTATLADRTGSHGEVAAMLTGPDGVVEAWVMSCRVFQRRVEHAFLSTVSRLGLSPTALRFAPTDRNEPLVTFLRENVGLEGNGTIALDLQTFAQAHESDVALFHIEHA